MILYKGDLVKDTNSSKHMLITNMVLKPDPLHPGDTHGMGGGGMWRCIAMGYPSYSICPTILSSKLLHTLLLTGWQVIRADSV